MRHCLLVAVTIVLASSLASAKSKPTPTTVALVNERLIQPLATKDRERSKFTRARHPPAERRVRMLDENEKQDGAGKVFFAFAVDTRHGWSKEETSWTKAAITGCVYPENGEVFIKRGNAYHPASAAVGKKTKAAPEQTCRAATQVSARD